MQSNNNLLPEHDIKHLAIIMDGNARWAKLNNLNALEGHKIGVKTIKNLLPIISNETNISYLTLYAFSSENWQRSKTEIDFLLSLLRIYLRDELKNLIENNIKLKIIGRLSLLNPLLQKKIAEAELVTKNNNGLTLCIAFSYSSKNEIIDACQKVIDNKVQHITEKEFTSYFYDPQMPDVDLIVRTGRQMRLSNFLLWQAAYAELIFSNKYWPEFDRDEIIKIMHEYNQRTRTFGIKHDFT